MVLYSHQTGKVYLLSRDFPQENFDQRDQSSEITVREKWEPVTFAHRAQDDAAEAAQPGALRRLLSVDSWFDMTTKLLQWGFQFVFGHNTKLAKRLHERERESSTYAYHQQQS